MDRQPPRFLTAEWRYLAMLNFEIDPRILQPFVPAGTELDRWEGKTFVSVVGFLFQKTRVLGIPIPFHRNFEEVNLRFYVRRRTKEGWQRAVVFIEEIVPRWAIAWTARSFYNENYVSLPMGHAFADHSTDGEDSKTLRYWWGSQRENYLQVEFGEEPREAVLGSNEEFITEHYWGYSARRMEAPSCIA